MTEPITPTTVRDEIAVMQKIVAAMDSLDSAAQDRVAGWLFDRYRIKDAAESVTPPNVITTYGGVGKSYQ